MCRAGSLPRREDPHSNMRPLSIWSIYFVAFAIVLGALAWFTLRVVDLERKQWRAVAESLREEREAEVIQRALWRMEYAIQPLLMREAARPWFSYAAFHVGEDIVEEKDARNPQRASFAPSELLGIETEFVRLHFEIAGNDGVTSPQAPGPLLGAIASDRGIAEVAALESARKRLAALSAIVRHHSLKRILIGIERAAEISGDPSGLVPQLPPLERSIAEYNARAKQIEANASDQNARNQAPARGSATAPKVHYGAMRAVWCGEELMLARHVNIDGEPVVQGCWLDRAEVEKQLLSDVANLLPGAKLLPRSPDAPIGVPERGLLLLGLPYQLSPGPIAVRDDEATYTGSTNPRLSLYIALASALVAALAVGIVLHVLLRASERRAAFVSAVTHELRTPLTTLRMYAEMLADGRVKEERHAHYFDTLRREADRLAALVENVLTFSRIEAHRAPPRIEAVALDTLVARSTERARERAERAGMSLVVAVEGGERSVLADVGAVEQIVFNLVDNACKYAAEADDKSIELLATADDSGARITVRDHGPGIDPAAAKRLFQPFRRPDKAETSGKPGVGLGLALCRRLARAMGGELSHVSDGGANFRLEVRVADAS